jgi:trehalose 6-phosphate synthase
MDGAITCNPFDVRGLAEAMARCLELDVDDRRARLAKMANQVHTHDVFAWGEGLLSTLIGAAAVDAPTETPEASS